MINPENSGHTSSDNSTDDAASSENDEDSNESDILENAVSVRIGRDGKTDWSVDMYNNDAAETMLGYLSGAGQLRFYFKDVEGANITATPVGYYIDTEGLADAVKEAYESNLGDTWGVDVYFWITKTIE